MSKTVAETLVAALEQLGVRQIFGLIGDSLNPLADAIRHSSVGFFRMLGKTANDMFVDVTIGVPDPGAVDTSAVATELPYGTVTVTAVKGGLEVPAESGGDAIIIANAAVVVSLDDGKTD